MTMAFDLLYPRFAPVTLYGSLLGGDASPACAVASRPRVRLPHWPCRRQAILERRRALKAILPASRSPSPTPGQSTPEPK
jgi:hypothetical protein